MKASVAQTKMFTPSVREQWVNHTLSLPGESVTVSYKASKTNPENMPLNSAAIQRRQVSPQIDNKIQSKASFTCNQYKVHVDWSWFYDSKSWCLQRCLKWRQHFSPLKLVDVFGFHVVSTQNYNNCKDIATAVKKHFNLWVCVCVCIKRLHCELFPVSTISPVFCAALCKSLEPYWSFLFFSFLKKNWKKVQGFYRHMQTYVEIQSI